MSWASSKPDFGPGLHCCQYLCLVVDMEEVPASLAGTASVGDKRGIVLCRLTRPGTSRLSVCGHVPHLVSSYNKCGATQTGTITILFPEMWGMATCNAWRHRVRHGERQHLVTTGLPASALLHCRASGVAYIEHPGFVQEAPA